MYEVLSMSGSDVRETRESLRATQTEFGVWVRMACAAIVGVSSQVIPDVAASQVSRWEKNGIQSNNASSLLYLFAVQALQKSVQKAIADEGAAKKGKVFHQVRQDVAAMKRKRLYEARAFEQAVDDYN